MWKSQFQCDELGTNPSNGRSFGVDLGEALWVPCKAVFLTQPRTRWVISHDADVQAPEPETEEQAWLPGPHGNQRGSQDSQPTSSARSAAIGRERRLEVAPMGEARPGAGAPGGHGLPPRCRITRSREIRNLLRRGKRRKTSHLDVFFLSSEGGFPRIGFVVPKHHRRVVDRNRLKRRLRGVGRREILCRLTEEGALWDLLIRARREAYEASYRQLRQELLEVTEELCSGRFFWR
jgi:ribonuclease P protein component